MQTSFLWKTISMCDDERRIYQEGNEIFQLENNEKNLQAELNFNGLLPSGVPHHTTVAFIAF